MRSGGPCSGSGASTKSNEKPPHAGPWGQDGTSPVSRVGLQRAGQGCVEGGSWREEKSGEGDGEMGVFARYLGDRTSRTW